VKIYLNGSLCSREDAHVSVFDHGFLYGDGVFEGIRVYDGNVFRLRQHLDRLYRSAASIGLEIPLAPDAMARAVLETVAANDKRDAYIRLVVSRGPGDLGIDPANCSGASLVIIVDTIKIFPPETYERGVSIMTSSIRRIPVPCLDPRIKSLNYLNNILAKIEARKAGAPEAVMLNTEGNVAEGTADNIFIVTRGEVRTPPLLDGALGGITRGAVLDLAREAGIPASERSFGPDELHGADEVFLTGTGAEIMPVVGVDGRTIGTGKPGRITLALLAAFRDLRTGDGAKVVYARAGIA
jgi:branched-chain amino acid aminotransferase